MSTTSARSICWRAHRDIRRIPCRRQIVRQIGEGIRIHLEVGRRFDRLAHLQVADAAQGSFPVLLQLRCDEPVVGVASDVAAFGKARLVPGLAQVQVEHVPALFLSLPVHPLRLERGLDRQRFYGPQQLARNRGFDLGAPNVMQRGKPSI